MPGPRTLYDKIWDAHVAHEAEDGTCLLYIDRHLVHEVTSPQAFEGLRMSGRKVRQPGMTVAVPDHNVPTSDRAKGIDDEESRIQVETLKKNAEENGITYYDVDDIRQGIKDYSDWPTIPQLYVKGEFVGGCDIITEMTLSGELDTLFEENGVTFDKDAADKIREANG